MTYDELNDFMLNYIENDISGRAIMLTGEWGVGKSYYVKNTLQPFLESHKGGNYKCAVVSLYGLFEIWEISKAIYMELRTIKKEVDSETYQTARVAGKIVGKTIVNGLVSKLGFDIGKIDNNDLQKVYESIDLSNKLIILEDIERTKIEIFELFGYINNMCENDGVKVLLVANENEFLTTYEKTDEQGKTVRYYSENALEYKRVKEKTVGDTIHFICNYEDTILNIMGNFGIYLNMFNNQKCAKDIYNIFMLTSSYNLRAFIYGCQKCWNIFEFICAQKIDIKDETKKKIFYGIIAFTQRQSRGKELQFTRETYISAELGVSEQYPLFRFCFDYIVYQTLSKEEIQKAVSHYTEYRRSSKWNTGRDCDLQIIKQFYIKTENEVVNAVLNLPKKIKDGDIPYYDYGVLVNFLIAIKYEVGIDIDIEKVENIILNNLKQVDNKIEFEELFNSGYDLYNEKALRAFEEAKLKIRKALEKTDILSFPYEPEKVDEFCNKNVMKLKAELKSKGFVHTLDIDRFIELLKNCSSSQISTLRSLLLNLYRDRHYTQILKEDIFVLNELYDRISSLYEYEGYDKIQKMQIYWFGRNISDIISSINGQMI
ncbi:MAG: hypothetical protein IJ147_02965 [Lachnospiraceae bacterium]|nr:hypothetical protein [Lachnospiraceae bacterium]